MKNKIPKIKAIEHIYGANIDHPIVFTQFNPEFYFTNQNNNKIKSYFDEQINRLMNIKKMSFIDKVKYFKYKIKYFVFKIKLFKYNLRYYLDSKSKKDLRKYCEKILKVRKAIKEKNKSMEVKNG